MVPQDRQTVLLRGNDEVLHELESVAGWKTVRVRRPVQILGSLDGIETGVGQLIECVISKLTIPTIAARRNELTIPVQLRPSIGCQSRVELPSPSRLLRA